MCEVSHKQLEQAVHAERTSSILTILAPSLSVGLLSTAPVLAPREKLNIQYVTGCGQVTEEGSRSWLQALNLKWLTRHNPQRAADFSCGIWAALAVPTVEHKVWWVFANSTRSLSKPEDGQWRQGREAVCRAPGKVSSGVGPRCSPGRTEDRLPALWLKSQPLPH